ESFPYKYHTLNAYEYTSSREERERKESEKYFELARSKEFLKFNTHNQGKVLLPYIFYGEFERK
ncbi:hypothetical protein, partial [Klebsiella pneumoniae]|uniref:hypothetical protein n=1 Tax=Klebsiella pneumoniae TaxID=573 RepID=UPI001BE07305